MFTRGHQAIHNHKIDIYVFYVSECRAGFLYPQGTENCHVMMPTSPCGIVMMPTLSSLATPQVVFMTTCGAASDEKVGIMTTYSVYKIHTMWWLHQQILNHIHIMISISCNMLFIASLKSIPHHYDLCIATSLTARCNINLLIFLYGCLPSWVPPNGTSQFAIHIINCSCYDMGGGGGCGLFLTSWVRGKKMKSC